MLALGRHSNHLVLNNLTAKRQRKLKQKHLLLAARLKVSKKPKRTTTQRNKLTPARMPLKKLLNCAKLNAQRSSLEVS